MLKIILLSHLLIFASFANAQDKFEIEITSSEDSWQEHIIPFKIAIPDSISSCSFLGDNTLLTCNLNNREYYQIAYDSSSILLLNQKVNFQFEKENSLTKYIQLNIPILIKSTNNKEDKYLFFEAKGNTQYVKTSKTDSIIDTLSFSLPTTKFVVKVVPKERLFTKNELEKAADTARKNATIKDSIVLGSFSLVEESKHYNKKETNFTKISVDSLWLHVKNYTIDQIVVYTPKGKFYNKVKQIPLLNFEAYQNFKLVNHKKGNKEYLLLGEVLEYNKELNQHYSYTDETIKLTTKNTPKQLTTELSANNVINYRIFTDIPAFVTDEPNGILQAEFSSKFPLNASPVKLKRRKKPFNSSVVVFGNYILPSLTLIKMEKSKSVVPLNTAKMKIINNDTTYRVNNFSVFQQSYTRIGLNINFVKFILSRHVDFLIDGKLSYNLGKVENSIKEPVNIAAIEYGGEAMLSTRPFENFGLDLSFISSGLSTTRNKYFEGDFASSAKQMNSIALEMFYHPVKKSSSKLFFRFRYYTALKTDYNDFYQLQIGYSSEFNYKNK